MSQWLLDTDHVSLILRGNQQVIQAAASRHPDVAISIITVQELFNGWVNLINQGNEDPNRLVQLYGKFANTIDFIKSVPILDFDESAKQVYVNLRSQNRKLSQRKLAKDVRIASIALANGATVVTRNQQDFSLIPNLSLEDWSLDAS
ncbi:type II toxin-antitoxin system VapC family toxin [Nodosilinea sp. AN01ver1]|uniref:type II toxin-antitoxin system VapC family toxin n=1 Tax=Nodosilinea sp. AN01ver1 TaxID=3423362 RepID=UPI003D31C3A3